MCGSTELMQQVSKPDIETEEVKQTWLKKIGNRYRLRKWRQELNQLVKETECSLAWIAHHINVGVSESPSFYNKLPQEKETYVKIGLILGQNRETVNRWITKNSKKPALYAKDPIDLIGIYLLDSKLDDYQPEYKVRMYMDCISEFKVQTESLRTIKRIKTRKDLIELARVNKKGITKHMYIKCAFNIGMTEEQINEVLELAGYDKETFYRPMGTIEIEKNIGNRKFSDNAALIRFVHGNQNSFKGMKASAREYIKRHVEALIQSKNRVKGELEPTWTAFKLKEMDHISNALYNFIMGDLESAQIPKKKSTYIMYAIELGMSLNQINQLLEIAGFDKLSISDSKDGFAEFYLTPLLLGWENTHTAAKNWREKYVNDNQTELSLLEEREGLGEILSMRNDLIHLYNKEKIEFPY